MGPAGIFGGSIIAASVYIVASANLAAESISLTTNGKVLDLETYQLESDNNSNEKEIVEKNKDEVLVDLIDS